MGPTMVISGGSSFCNAGSGKPIRDDRSTGRALQEDADGDCKNICPRRRSIRPVGGGNRMGSWLTASVARDTRPCRVTSPPGLGSGLYGVGMRLQAVRVERDCAPWPQGRHGSDARLEMVER